MNIMILSPGRRVDVVEFFHLALKAVGGKVITVDMTPYASGLYSGDSYYCVHKDLSAPDAYIRKTIEIGQMEKADAVLTLVDPELPLLAQYRDLYLQNGICPILSEGDLAQVTLDKYSFYEAFREIIPLVPTFINKEDILVQTRKGDVLYPIIAKPRGGSGSDGLCTISTEEEFLSFSKEGYIFQPFFKKKEYGCDVYFDLVDGGIKRIFIKEKIKMRCGETDQAISVHSDSITNLILKLEGKGFRGPVDIDVFETFEGTYVINEINPRFGGGYPLAYHCGQNFMDCIVTNLLGKPVTQQLGDYTDGIIMMKYNGLFFTEQKNLALSEN